MFLLSDAFCNLWLHYIEIVKWLRKTDLHKTVLGYFSEEAHPSRMVSSSVISAHDQSLRYWLNPTHSQPGFKFGYATASAWLLVALDRRKCVMWNTTLFV